MNTVLQSITAFVFSALLMMASVLPVAAQSKEPVPSAPQNQSPAHVQPPLAIEQNTVFFNNYRIGKDGPEKGEFETTEEYKKRLLAPWDTGKVVYFKIDGDSLWGNTRYKYDADTQDLTALAGKEQELKISYNPRGATPILLQEYELAQGSYEASNAFGATVKVEKSTYIDYTLNFMNLKRCPKAVFDKDSNQFMMTIKREPAAADVLSKNLEIVVGVKLLGYKYSDSEVAFQSRIPTLDRPYEFTKVVSVIDANLYKVLLCTRDTHEVLAEYDVI